MPNGSPPNEGLGKNRPLLDETNFRAISGEKYGARWKESCCLKKTCVRWTNQILCVFFFTMDIFFLIMSNSSKKQNNSKKYPHLFQTNKYPKDPNIIWLPKHYPQDSPQLPTNLTPKDGSRSRTCKARWSHRRKMCLGVISIVEQTLVVNCKPKTSPLSGNSFFFRGFTWLLRVCSESKSRCIWRTQCRPLNSGTPLSSTI